MSNPISPLSIARQLSVSNTMGDQNRLKVRRDIASLSEQLSSGKRINRASDDPAGFEQARRLDLLSKEFAQYQRSIGASQRWNNATQHSIDGLIERFSSAHERAVQAANDTLGDDQRAAIANDLRGLRTDVISTLNDKVDDEYLFAGNATKTQPFDPSTGAPSTSYAAIEDDRTRSIGPDQQLKINITGRELHEMDGGASIVDALDNLIAAVDPGTANPPPIDGGPAPGTQQEAIQNGLDAITRARDHVIDMGARAGVTARQLESAAGHLDEAGLLAESRRSEIEDVDFTEAITQMQSKQNTLQAALQVVASAQQISLVDFL